ncbi:hypothetical protein D3C77_180310 [compost metagenome]
MIRPWPVERRALDDQQFFREQQVKDELFVVVDRADFRVNPREGIKRPHGFDAADTGNVVEQLPGAVALLQQAAGWQNQIIDALVAAQGGLNGVLARNVGAQAHVGQHVDAFDVALGVLLGPGDGQPAGAETRHPVGLGQAVEGQAEQVRGQRCGADVHRLIVKNLVVDFVGEHHQVVLARQLQHAQEQFTRVHRAGGVVRVDDHQRFGVGSDLGLDVVKVREPVGLFIAQVVHRVAAGQAYRGGPQRIVRCRDQDFIAVVEQGLHRHHDQFGDAVAQVDVFDTDTFDLLLLVILHDRLARAEQAFGVTVALGGRQVADHVLEDFVRRLETKGRRVADVQLEDAMAFLFQAFGVLEHRAANVIADIGELVRFADLHDVIPIRKDRRALRCEIV